MKNPTPSMHLPHLACSPIIQDKPFKLTEEETEAKRNEFINKIEEAQRECHTSFACESPFFPQSVCLYFYRWLYREVDFVVNNPDHDMECQVYGEMVTALKLTAISEAQYKYLYGLLYKSETKKG